MLRKLFRINTIVFVFVSMLGTVIGQYGSELNRRILDSNGAAIPGAQVILKGLTIRFQQALQTGPDGSYFVPKCSIGRL
ncbi:MAG: hypothetical protein C4324_11565 [Blastocatellia bacterium]